MANFWSKVFLSLVIFLFSLFVLTLFPSQSRGEESINLGEEICKECHEDIFNYYSLTPHKGANGCENCHGPGQGHVENGGDTTLIFAFKGITGQESAGVCLKCHSKQRDKFDYLRSDHGLSGVSCNKCHQPHLPKPQKNLLQSPEKELCYSCHKEMEAQFALPRRHKVESGFIKCSDCHNVHAKMGQALVSRWDRETLCGRCHKDKTGPFIYEHKSSLVEGCLICHTPHGSVNRHLLLYQDDRLLCLSCHPLIPGFHNNVNFAGRRCTDCHAAIHGSNSSPVFFR